jgi:spermidine/putrescine transport system substrate-binding protein
VPPEEGFAIWTDNVLVPNKAEHKTNVETMMDFYYDPVNAAKLSAWNYYFCPVAGAQDEIARYDKSAVNSEFIFVDDKTLDTGYQFMSLSDSEETTYQRQFNEVMSG